MMGEAAHPAGVGGGGAELVGQQRLPGLEHGEGVVERGRLDERAGAAGADRRGVFRPMNTLRGTGGPA